MEIDERALRAMVDEVDDQHHEGMRSMADDIAELHFGEGRKLRTRRSVLTQAGVGGIALTIGNAVLPAARLLPAGAQELTDADIATFAQSIELAAVEAYKAAAGSGKVTTPAVGEAAGVFMKHHQDHANAFGGAGGSAKQANQKLLTAVGDQLKAAQDEKAVLTLAYDLENAAAATYLFSLGALKSKAALELAASILPVESQHAVILGSVLGKDLKTIVPAFQTEEGKVDPAQFPAK